MAWYNLAWKYRVKVTALSSRVLANYTNFPLLVTEANMPSHFFSNVKSNGSDIVCTSSDGTTKLNRDLVSLDTSNSKMMLRFRAQLSTSSNSVYYIYYGNASGSETNSSSAYPSAMKCCFDFEESVSDTAPQYKDRISSGHDLTANSYLSDSSSGRPGKSPTNSSTNQGMASAGSGWTQPTTYGTVLLWYRPTTVPPSTSQNIFLAANSGSTSYLQLFITNTNSYFGWLVSGTSYTISLTTSTLFTANNWHHVSFHYSNGNSQAIYIDGSLKGSNSAYSGASTSKLRTDMSQGSVDSLKVFNTKLTINEVGNYRRNENSPSTFYSVDSVEYAPNLLDGLVSGVVAKTYGPTFVAGSLTVTGSAATALASTLDPEFVAGSVSVGGLVSSAIADTIGPEGTDVTIVGLLANAIASTTGPEIICGSVAYAADPATAVANTLDPSVVLGSTTINNAVAGVIAETVAPDVYKAVYLVMGAAGAVGSTVTPSVVMGSLSLATTAAGTIADTVDPSVLSGTNYTHWWWSRGTGGFFKDVFTDQDLNPIAVCSYDGDAPEDRVILLGSESGYIRQTDDSLATDDGSTIVSEVIIPIPSAHVPQVLYELQLITDDDSGYVSWGVHAGDYMEDAVGTAVAAAGTFAAGDGVSPTHNPRVRGFALATKLSSTARWAMEELRAKVTVVGSSRSRTLAK